MLVSSVFSSQKTKYFEFHIRKKSYFFSDDHVIQPTSPTKNYLTQFPVVKGQQKPPSEKLHPQMTAASTTTSKSNAGKYTSVWFDEKKI